VVAGTPLEFHFTLATTVVASGRVTFVVSNGGRLRHRFKICSQRGLRNDNYCAGAQTRWIDPQSSAVLRVFFHKKGVYEFLCGVRGHAAAGMKGVLTVM
jgi:uncharacterized cupredoxin-like copper-binding protein